MPEPGTKIVAVNQKGLFCRGDVRVLVGATTMQDLHALLASGRCTPQNARDLLQWGYDRLNAFPKFTAPTFDSPWGGDVKGRGLFVPYSLATIDNYQIPIQVPTREAFGWDALAAIHADLPKFRHFLRVLKSFQPFDGYPEIAFLASPTLASKLRSANKLTIKAVDFADRFIDSECFVIYSDSFAGGGFIDVHGNPGRLATARSYSSLEAARRNISSSTLSPSSCVVVRGKVQLTDICADTVASLPNVPGLRQVMASLHQRAIREALEQATVEELKARLATLEADQPTPPPASRPRRRL